MWPELKVEHLRQRCRDEFKVRMWSQIRVWGEPPPYLRPWVTALQQLGCPDLPELRLQLIWTIADPGLGSIVICWTLSVLLSSKLPLFLGDGSQRRWQLLRHLSPTPHVSAPCGTLTDPELTYKPRQFPLCHLQPKGGRATRRWNLSPKWREYLIIGSLWHQRVAQNNRTKRTRS